MAKLTGRERYVDDLETDGHLWGATVRSDVPRGRIRGIEFGLGVDWSEFTVVTADDIPGRNAVFLMEYDQPALADGHVRHVHEPVALLAHPSREMVRRAAKLVTVHVDPEPPVLDFTASPSSEQVQHGDDNVLEDLLIEKGDVERALAEAPIVVEGEYFTGAQEHVYLETQGMLASVEDGIVVIRGSMQCPYYVVKALKPLLGVDESGLRVIQTATGGGFGGKEEYPSMVAAHAALLALASGRPVKLVYDRWEDMAVTTKRHPSRVRHRTGVDESGRLLAQDIEVVLDGGAYVTLSPVVLSRAVIHAGGPYACDHVRIRGRAMLTNAVPFGAFRGFGAPQAFFGLERHMDVVADRVGLDPAELRRRNLIENGQSTATSQTIDDGVDREAVLDRALELSEWTARRAEIERHNATDPLVRRGIGLATFHHGAGFTGNGEVALESVVRVAGTPEGGVEVRAASVEMGQGTTTIFTQFAADRLGLDPDLVVIATPDTHRVPDSGPSVASRTAMVVGRLVERACDDLRRRLGLSDQDRGNAVSDAIRAWYAERGHRVSSEGAGTGGTGTGRPGTGGAGTEEARAGEIGTVEPVGEAVYEPPPGVEWDEETYRGDAYGAYAWAAYVAEITVDLRTCETRVTDFTAVQEVGKVLNDTLARGQIQGGVAQAISWALLEDFRWKDGAMENAQLTNYIIPTSDDLPPIEVDFLEVPYEHGAQGAKGIGELPMDGPAPAVANAIAHALGVPADRIPLTPERLLAAWNEHRRRERAS
ncbi:MAG: xanthine dehydrogenase family protein molybdopterin-binding subunit [Gemmatimonadota bacterium]